MVSEPTPQGNHLPRASAQPVCFGLTGVRSTEPPKGRAEATERTERRVLRVRIPPSPPSSLLLRRLSIHIQSSTEKIPRFRGVVADRLCTTEPETEGSEHNWRRHPRLSLLPSWAVRFRSRFALAGFGQKRAVPRVRILACQSGRIGSARDSP